MYVLVIFENEVNVIDAEAYRELSIDAIDSFDNYDDALNAAEYIEECGIEAYRKLEES